MFFMLFRVGCNNVCDAWCIEIPCFENGRTPQVSLCSRPWRGLSKLRCFMSGWGFVSGLRVPKKCFLEGAAKAKSRPFGENNPFAFALEATRSTLSAGRGREGWREEGMIIVGCSTLKDCNCHRLWGDNEVSGIPHFHLVL